MDKLYGIVPGRISKQVMRKGRISVIVYTTTRPHLYAKLRRSPGFVKAWVLKQVRSASNGGA